MIFNTEELREQKKEFFKDAKYEDFKDIYIQPIAPPIDKVYFNNYIYGETNETM